MTSYDIFISYAHVDSERAHAIRGALAARGLNVWLDEAEIADFDGISRSIGQGLAQSKALLALYSAVYPTRRACQWELMAVFLGAERHGDPCRRVLVVNLEARDTHIEPSPLRNALFLRAPVIGDESGFAELGRRVADHVAGLSGALGDLGAPIAPAWYGKRPLGSTRFVGRLTDMWNVHSALAAGEVALDCGARGASFARMTGMGGIGKSLLAEEYAIRFGAGYPGGVFWLRASHDATKDEPGPQTGRAEQDEQLRAFAIAVSLPVADLSPPQVRAALAGALDAREQPYLWVVDDLQPRSDLDSWLAPSRWGKTLVTTRIRDDIGPGIQIDLGVLPQDEGVELLSAHREPRGEDEQTAARALVNDLGGHALAIDVAGAALRAEQGIRSFAAFRHALAHPTHDELELATELSGDLPDRQSRSIATTLTRSIALLDESGLDFLRLAALLAEHPIPASLVVAVFADADDLEPDVARRRAVKAMHDARLLSLADIVGDDGLSAARRKFGRDQAATVTGGSCWCSSRRVRRFARSSRVNVQSKGLAILL